MAITLGHNQYGKAETRVVRIFRDTEPHEIADYNVSVALVGDFDDVHYSGDNTKCLTTTRSRKALRFPVPDSRLPTRSGKPLRFLA